MIFPPLALLTQDSASKRRFISFITFDLRNISPNPLFKEGANNLIILNFNDNSLPLKEGLGMDVFI
jgi:hypothetical protein